MPPSSQVKHICTLPESAPNNRRDSSGNVREYIVNPYQMAEHLYMFTGESVRVKFRAARFLLDDLTDWFGTDMVYSDVTEEMVTASVKVNEQAMELWALQIAASKYNNTQEVKP